jgi:hypothetical protein
MIASELSRQPKVSRIGPDSRRVADFSGGMFQPLVRGGESAKPLTYSRMKLRADGLLANHGLPKEDVLGQIQFVRELLGLKLNGRPKRSAVSSVPPTGLCLQHISRHECSARKTSGSSESDSIRDAGKQKILHDQRRRNHTLALAATNSPCLADCDGVLQHAPATFIEAEINHRCGDFSVFNQE